jgi:hypothetical protein
MQKISTHPSYQGQDDADSVGKVDMQVEKEDGDGNGQDLFTVRGDRHRQSLRKVDGDETSESSSNSLHSQARHGTHPSLLVGRETDDVQTKSNHPVDE